MSIRTNSTLHRLFGSRLRAFVTCGIFAALIVVLASVLSLGSHTSHSGKPWSSFVNGSGEMVYPTAGMDGYEPNPTEAGTTVVPTTNGKVCFGRSIKPLAAKGQSRYFSENRKYLVVNGVSFFTVNEPRGSQAYNMLIVYSPRNCTFTLLGSITPYQGEMFTTKAPAGWPNNKIPTKHFDPITEQRYDSGFYPVKYDYFAGSHRRPCASSPVPPMVLPGPNGVQTVVWTCGNPATVAS